MQSSDTVQSLKKGQRGGSYAVCGAVKIFGLYWIMAAPQFPSPPRLVLSTHRSAMIAKETEIPIAYFEDAMQIIWGEMFAEYGDQ